MLEDLELDVGSESWTREPLREAERDAAMSKANRFLDDFFTLDLDAGSRTLSRADKQEILGLEATESAWQTQRPAQSQPNPWQPVLEFVKTEREKIRSQASVTRDEVRSSLVALSQLFGRVANGNL